MRVTLKLPEGNRRRQDESVRHAEKLAQHGTLRRDPGPLRIRPTVQINAAHLRHESLDRQAKSVHRAWPSTWGMSVEAVHKARTGDFGYLGYPEGCLSYPDAWQSIFGLEVSSRYRQCRAELAQKRS
jgi:hypothetical protein